MREWLKGIWLRKSIYRAILLALLLTSIIPIIMISTVFIHQSTDALTRQMENNLVTLVEAKTEATNLELNAIINSTKVAAYHATRVLDQPDSSDPTIDRYQPDQRNIVGLDTYYNEQGGASVLGDNLSNVYWNNDISLDNRVVGEIVHTESLDPVFESIKSISPETQWIYLTTPDGMMRLYPWASNDQYPDNWDPRDTLFYRVAEPENNPTLKPQWTPPYVDFAGAGWMVTLSIPIMDKNSDFLGVMSQDITINSLKAKTLDIQVFDGVGYGFLINDQGKVIVHPNFQDDAASKGSQEEANLLNYGTADFQSLVQQMVNGETGLGYFDDPDLGEQILVYAPISSINWSLGIVVPRKDVIAPAMAMRTNALIVTVILVITVVALAVILTRALHKPLTVLLQGVNLITEDRQANKIHIDSFLELKTLADAFNNMASKIWERQKQLKAKVASLTIRIDTQRKQNEVDALVKTDYFQHLEINAELLRKNLRKITKSDHSKKSKV